MGILSPPTLPAKTRHTAPSRHCLGAWSMSVSIRHPPPHTHTLPQPNPIPSIRSTLAGLKTRPGLHTWPVLTGSARFKGVKTPRRLRPPTALSAPDAEPEADTAALNGTPSSTTTATPSAGAAVAPVAEPSKADTVGLEEGGDDGEGGAGAEGEQFVEPAVASDAPLEDAVKAGLRHHPSFAEVDMATSRK